MLPFRKQLLGLHWRLRDFTLRPQALDFQAFARDCWFGPLDINPFRLVDDSVGVGLDLRVKEGRYPPVSPEACTQVDWFAS